MAKAAKAKTKQFAATKRMITPHGGRIVKPAHQLHLRQKVKKKPACGAAKGRAGAGRRLWRALRRAVLSVAHEGAPRRRPPQHHGAGRRALPQPERGGTSWGGGSSRSRAAEAEDETAQELRRHKSAIEEAFAELVCPITFSLPFDPVIAKDGKVYERSAIEEWLKQQGKSPLTNLPMGKKLLPAMHVKNMIRVMVASGTLTGDKADEWELRRKEEEQAAAEKVAAEKVAAEKAAAEKAAAKKAAALRKAARRGDDHQLRNLLKAGAAVDAADDEGLTALMLAAQNGHEPCLLVLLEAGAVVSAQSNAGATALGAAAQNGHEQLALVLLEAGAAVNAQNNDGRTALMVAAQDGHEQVALVLLKAGAAVDETEEDGWTAL
eukprot:jgi/Chrpa1/6153/Chrysochromulina_OHIO_Genome00016199-RA